MLVSFQEFFWPVNPPATNISIFHWLVLTIILNRLLILSPPQIILGTEQSHFRNNNYSFYLSDHSRRWLFRFRLIFFSYRTFQTATFLWKQSHREPSEKCLRLHCMPVSWSVIFLNQWPKARRRPRPVHCKNQASSPVSVGFGRWI